MDGQGQHKLQHKNVQNLAKQCAKWNDEDKDDDTIDIEDKKTQLPQVQT